METIYNFTSSFRLVWCCFVITRVSLPVATCNIYYPLLPRNLPASLCILSTPVGEETRVHVRHNSANRQEKKRREEKERKRERELERGG